MSANVPARPDAPLVDQQLKTTSLHIAEKFGKRHDDVLKRIANLDVPENYHLRNFAEMVREVEIGSGATRQSKYYELTRDGFALLVMGFTGKRAMAWKIKFLEAFNQMESQLRTAALPASAQPGYVEGIRAALRHKSPEELADWAHGAPDKIGQVITYLETTLLDPGLSRDARRELTRIHAIARRIRGGSDTP